MRPMPGAYSPSTMLVPTGRVTDIGSLLASRWDQSSPLIRISAHRGQRTSIAGLEVAINKQVPALSLGPGLLYICVEISGPPHEQLSSRTGEGCHS